MKQLISLLLTVFCLLAIVDLSPAAAELEVSAGLRYDTFTDDHEPTTIGYEVTLPFGLNYRWRRLLLTLDTALSSANVFPGDDADAELAGLTDTHLSLSYGLPNLPVGMIAGLDLNLPSGQERLNDAQRAAEIGENHDLFEIDDFGEGFNVELSLGLAKQIGDVSLSLNGAYQFTGEYDPTQDVADDDLDPGDRLRISGLLRWQAVSWLDLDASLSYAHFSSDTLQGAKNFQEGEKYTLGATLHIHTLLRKPVSIVAGLQQTVQGKNRVLDGEQRFGLESENSNGREIFGILDLLYHSSPRLTLRLLGDLRYYGESKRTSSATGLPLEGQRARYAFGPGFIYHPSKRLALNGLVKYFVLHQEQDVLWERETTFRGVNLAVGLTYTF